MCILLYMRSRERVDANLNSLLPSHKEVLEFYDAHAWVHFKAVFILLLVKIQRYAFEYRKEHFYALLEKHSIASRKIIAAQTRCPSESSIQHLRSVFGKRNRTLRVTFSLRHGLNDLYNMHSCLSDKPLHLLVPAT